MTPSETEHRTEAAADTKSLATPAYGNFVCCAVIALVALWIGCAGYQDSGPLWPDSPQYLNAAVMIRDWIFSQEFQHPFQFAARNYARYPAFHLPYHPPVYPGLLGVFFAIAGVSYITARVFVALCLGVAGCSFF